jgi:hypothetical protein
VQIRVEDQPEEEAKKMLEGRHILKDPKITISTIGEDVAMETCHNFTAIGTRDYVTQDVKDERQITCDVVVDRKMHYGPSQIYEEQTI